MFLQKCASEVWEARKKGRRGDMRPATDLGERSGKNARPNVPELPNTTFIVVIHRMLNGNNDPTSSMQFQDSYTDVRHWKELFDFIEKKLWPERTILCNCGIPMQLDSERGGRRVHGIIRTGANDE
jgi:hypothetical protein